MTLFAVYFPIEIVVRIWDVFLIEGRKTIFRLALAILKINEKELMKCDMSSFLLILKSY
jgi:Rab-GTPase-TBC domain